MHGLRKLLLLQTLTCFGQHVLGGKIINGEKVPESSMLYMVSLQTGRGHVCGGFLVSDQFVITAAHCKDHSLTRVVLGTHDLLRAGPDKVRSIEKRHIHPYYKAEHTGYDIMILKLSKKVKLDNSIQTIKLPRSDANLRGNQTCRIAGWGTTESHSPTVDGLRAVNVSVIDLEVCKKQLFHLPNNVICAGGYQTKNGFCQGDSGGPLVCSGFAFGIMSYMRGDKCDYPDVPNVYTDIRKYKYWIKKVIGYRKPFGYK